MSLPHALLTALAEHPGSGSELASRFDRSIGYFWHATHQQIYRELSRLEGTGWVESLPQASTRGRKRSYRILPAGREELRRWIAQHDDPKPIRDELLVRLRAEAAIGPSGLDAQVRWRLSLHQDQLALFRRIEAKDFADPHPSREKQLQHLVLKAGIEQQELLVRMAEEALRVLALAPTR
jgi:DNA-binding PadR family transcriptional regulator